MKRSFLIVAMALCLSAVNAQPNEGPDWSGKVYVIGKIYPGFYVTNANDTVYGYFQHGTQAGNQKKCSFYTNEMDRKPTSEFKPDDLKSYKVGDKLYRSINFSGGLNNKALRFNLVTKDGGITEYVFYSEDGSATPEPVFHKPHDPNNNKPLQMGYFALGFAKKVAEYVSDYPALAAKVSGKEKGYGMLNLLAIFDEYNAWYAAKKK
ncbi:MAG: hypothetical protein JNM19_15570 [Chitinophagaceae bacterium]|nr:hypothetical protein [Chitinophagaceae bacterium]